MLIALLTDEGFPWKEFGAQSDDHRIYGANNRLAVQQECVCVCVGGVCWDFSGPCQF